jgi:hypothetical protein
MAERFREILLWGAARPRYRGVIEVWERALGLLPPDSLKSLNALEVRFCDVTTTSWEPHEKVVGPSINSSRRGKACGLRRSVELQSRGIRLSNLPFPFAGKLSYVGTKSSTPRLPPNASQRLSRA